MFGWSELGTWVARFRDWPWYEIKSDLELLIWFLAIVAVFGCLIRLGAIRAIIQDFRESSGTHLGSAQYGGRSQDNGAGD